MLLLHPEPRRLVRGAAFNELGVGRYNRLLQKLFQMKGGPPASQLSGDIQVNFNLFNGVENRYLEGWNRFGSTGWATAATVGQTAGICLRNPGGSNVIAIIEKLALSASITQELDVSSSASALNMTSVVAGTPFDLRGATEPICIVSQGVDSPASVAIIGRARVLADTMYEYIQRENQELTLLPGAALRVVTTVANSALVVAGMWRERFLEESERT